MKLWTFLFPSPSCRQASARVAAPDRPSAWLVLAEIIGEPALDTICHYAGQNPEITMPRVLSV
ncbi:MAG TPA: hypothetical protein VKV96_12190, partial [Roseiarcus sp.]|nr:hypothetical protein [Roseiarcus sp.]